MDALTKKIYSADTLSEALGELEEPPVLSTYRRL
jgi:hypothetical protein